MKRFKLTFQTKRNGPQRQRHMTAETAEQAKALLQSDYLDPIRIISVVPDPVRYSNAEQQFQTKVLDTRVRRWR